MPTQKLTICLGFDGSTTGDWTAIRAETADGYLFTPVYGRDKRPTYWNPSLTGNSIPRYEVHAAVEELFEKFQVKKMYCDPREWETDIEEWSLSYGEETVFKWSTARPGSAMFDALERFKTDLFTGRITHDNCKSTALHISNAVLVPKRNEQYGIGKPHGVYTQKIDLAVSSVLAHEAAADSRVTGWTAKSTRPKMIVRRR